MNTLTAEVETRSGLPAADNNGSTSTASSYDRRHDLDALRAIAMLLGIVLHVGLSFSPIPWTVQDSQQSEFYSVLFSLIHGFRMPLFFMLSGFFTAMLWRKRGLASLLKHRFMRIALPLFIGCMTIIPAMWVVGYIASRPSPGSAEGSALFAAVVSNDVEAVRNELLKSDSGIDTVDATSGSPPLCSAVFLGHTEIVQLLIDADADINLPNQNQSTPLHIAAFMGRAPEAKLLIDAGANQEARDGSMMTPGDLLKTDFATTNFIASSLGVPMEEESLTSSRQEIANLLNESDYLGSGSEGEAAASLDALKALLFQFPVFMHLWFLWFLCWLVVAFLAYVLIANSLNIQRLPQWFVCSPISLLWLVPLTLVPQSFMTNGIFGPDSSVGLLPFPSVLAYYAIFFFFGALYWDMDDQKGQLGQRWYVSLPVALLIVFPIGLDLVTNALGLVPRFADESTNALVGNILQVIFAWLMTFGLIGLFREHLSQQSKTLRYVSDSSYWLYLVHLPLVIFAQWLVRDLQVPSLLKFATITVLISALLLFTYEYMVRYTWIGRMLNGPRKRPA